MSDNACVCAKSLQLCLTLWDTMDGSPTGSSVHGLLQARILNWVAMASSRDLPNLEIESPSPEAPALQADSFTTEPPGKTMSDNPWPLTQTLMYGNFKVPCYVNIDM